MIRKYLPHFLILTHLILGVTSIRTLAPTSDEVVHLASGYSYLKTGDFRLNKEHPPLQKLLSGLPLVFLGASFPKNHPYWDNSMEWNFSDMFFYNNKVSPDTMIFWGRIPTILISCLLAFFVFLWTKQLFGEIPALVALGLYAFCPNMLANGTLITTDTISSAFIFINMYFLWKYIKAPGKKNMALCGVTFGLALASKFTTVVLFPVYIAVIIANWYSHLFIPGHVRDKQHKSFPVSDFILIFILGALVVVLIYGIGETGRYFEGLRRVMGEAGKNGHTSYLMGKFSNTGWWYYYIIAFLLKTPSALLVFFMLGLMKLIPQIRKRYMHFFKNELLLLVPIILIFISGSLSKKQLGIRYILPVYPFIFVLSASIAQSINKKLINRIVIGILCLWFAVSSLRIFPYYLAYFNEFAGGPDKGWHYLADSNIDWGQDILRLKNYMNKNNVDSVILSYFGTADPNYYGINFQDFGMLSMFNRKSIASPVDSKNEIIALSVNNLVGIDLYDRTVFNWLEERTPDAKIGYSIFVYNITGDIFSNERLAEIYLNSGWLDLAEKHARKLLLMNKNNRIAYFVLACAAADKGENSSALNYYARLKRISTEYLPSRNHLMNYSSQMQAGREVKPEYIHNCLYKLGNIYWNNRMFAQAVEIYKKITVIYPDSVEAWNNMGVVYEKLRRFADSIISYRKALELKPDYEEAYINLSVCYWTQGDYESMLNTLEKLLKINPDNARALQYKKMALEKRGNRKK